MMVGEFEKRLHVLTSFATRYTLNDEEWIKVNEIVGQIQRINEKNISKVLSDARKDLFDYFRRGLIHEGLEKWFGEVEK